MLFTPPAPKYNGLSLAHPWDPSSHQKKLAFSDKPHPSGNDQTSFLSRQSPADAPFALPLSPNQGQISRFTAREYRGMKRVAPLITRDQLLMSLLADPERNHMAEDRVFELLYDNLPTQEVATPGLEALMNHNLRDEARQLKEQMATKDEKIAFLTRQVKNLESEVGDVRKHFEEATKSEQLTEMIRQSDDKRLNEVLMRMKESLETERSAATKASGEYHRRVQDLQSRLDSTTATKDELQRRVVELEDRTTDVKLYEGMQQLQRAFAGEVSNMKAERDAHSEEVAVKDDEILGLREHSSSLEQRIEDLQQEIKEVNTFAATLEAMNKAAQQEVDSLQSMLQNNTELEALTQDIRSTLADHEAATLELLAEKEHSMKLELENKSLEHRLDVAHTQLNQGKDVQSVADEVRELVSGANAYVEQLLAEKERALKLEVENAALRKEVEELRARALEQPSLQALMAEIREDVSDARAAAADLLHEKEKAVALQSELGVVRQELAAVQAQGGQVEELRALAGEIRGRGDGTRALTEELLSEKERSRQLEVQNKMLSYELDVGKAQWQQGKQMKLLSDELQSWQQVAGDVTRGWKGGSVLGGSVGGDSAGTRRITPRDEAAPSPAAPGSARGRPRTGSSSSPKTPGQGDGLHPIHESAEFSRSNQLSPSHNGAGSPALASPRRAASVSPRGGRGVGREEEFGRRVQSMSAAEHSGSRSFAQAHSREYARSTRTAVGTGVDWQPGEVREEEGGGGGPGSAREGSLSPRQGLASLPARSGGGFGQSLPAEARGRSGGPGRDVASLPVRQKPASLPLSATLARSSSPVPGSDGGGLTPRRSSPPPSGRASPPRQPPPRSRTPTSESSRRFSSAPSAPPPDARFLGDRDDGVRSAAGGRGDAGFQSLPVGRAGRDGAESSSLFKARSVDGYMDLRKEIHKLKAHLTSAKLSRSSRSLASRPASRAPADLSLTPRRTSETASPRSPMHATFSEQSALTASFCSRGSAADMLRSRKKQLGI